MELPGIIVMRLSGAGIDSLHRVARRLENEKAGPRQDRLSRTISDSQRRAVALLELLAGAAGTRIVPPYARPVDLRRRARRRVAETSRATCPNDHWIPSRRR